MLLFASTVGFTSTSHFLFPWPNSEWAVSWYVYAYIPVINTGYFYSSVLDSLITLDKIACFKTSVRNRIKFSPYKLSEIAAVLCVAINSPYFFFYQPNSRKYAIGSNQTLTVTAGTTSTSIFGNRPEADTNSINRQKEEKETKTTKKLTLMVLMICTI
jgi:hypothetical protein